MGTPTVVKLSLNIAQHQVDTVRRIAEAQNISMTEVIRHAIALEAFVHDAHADGSRIVIEDKRGDKKLLVPVGNGWEPR